MYRYIFMTLALLILFASWAMPAGKVLLIGSGAPDAKDALLIDKLKSWGFTVEPHGHQEKPAGKPIEGDFDFVFISESTSSANILGAYTNSTIPVVNAETWTYDDMGFAADGTFDDGVGDTLKIVKNDHPITEGLPDKVKIHKPVAIIMTCSGLEGDLEILATRDDNEDLVAISVYEQGAKTMKGATKARHVNIFPHSTGWNMLTDDAWKLVENSVLYALGRIPLAVDAKEKLATRWADIKTQQAR